MAKPQVIISGKIEIITPRHVQRAGISLLADLTLAILSAQAAPDERLFNTR